MKRMAEDHKNDTYYLKIGNEFKIFVSDRHTCCLAVLDACFHVRLVVK